MTKQKSDYRIKESCGHITIQRLGTYTKGHLWWKAEVSEWQNLPHVYTDLKSAMLGICIFSENDKYYNHKGEEIQGNVGDVLDITREQITKAEFNKMDKEISSS